MVDSLREPSKYMNKSLTEMLYVIASNSKGGVLYEKGAVRNAARFEQQYASTKSAIEVEDGALSGGKLQPKAQAALPTGYENIYNISNQSLAEVTGINREFLGMSEAKQVSALLESQRINQVISTLAGPFDSITLYAKEHARLMLTWLKRIKIGPGELQRPRDLRLVGLPQEVAEGTGHHSRVGRGLVLSSLVETHPREVNRYGGDPHYQNHRRGND